MRPLSIAAMVTALVIGSAGAAWAADQPLFGPMSPGRVVGELTAIDTGSEGSIEELGELMYRVEDAVATYRLDSDDARLGGILTSTGSWTGYYPPALVAISDVAWLIEDERGTWSGSSHGVSSMADGDPINVNERVDLDGAGAYAGLTAYLVIDWAEETFVGALIPDVMPELPDDWMEIYQASAA